MVIISVIKSERSGFEVNTTCNIYGESMIAYSERTGIQDTIKPPTIQVNQNSAFINMAPLSLSHLIIISGRENLSHHYGLSFSAITAQQLLFIKDCTLVAHQGSAIVANSCQAHIIMQKCHVIPRFYCCWCRDSRIVWESCFGNKIAMNERGAIGCGSLDESCAQTWIKKLKMNESVFDETLSWPRPFVVEE